MALVYHRPSGTTHVLLPPAPEILAILSTADADVAGIAAALMTQYGAEAEEPVAGIVAARLTELVEAGLVARA